jgi:hypothetical protein
MIDGISAEAQRLFDSGNELGGGLRIAGGEKSYILALSN